jgi:hypothetical protein
MQEGSPLVRFSGLFALLVCAGFLVSCQGDQGIPSDPGRGLDLTGPGPCKDAAFVSAVAIYTDSSVQNSKLQACKDILALAKQNKLGEAEVGIDDLLVAIYNDYNGGAAGLAPVGGQSLTQSVANYIEATCGLAPLTDSECLTPNDLDTIADGIDADDLKGWLAAGPLSSAGTSLATGVLLNGLFAFGVEDANAAYVFVSERPRTGVDGPCPGTYPNDCQDDVFDVDVDGAFTSVSVESCIEFGVEHVRCPDGGPCEPGEVADPLFLVDDEACTIDGYAMMGLWGKLAFQATRPAHWLIQATPANAGLTSKFGAFSPVTASDDNPRSRDVICDVTANYPSGSEGTICRILDHGEEIASCVTASSGPYTSSCQMSPLVPENLSLLMTAAKTGGDGAYNASQAFTLGPADPERGGTKTVSFNLQPPGKKKK